MSDVPGNLTLPYRHVQVGYGTILALGTGFVTQTGKLVRDLRRRRGRLWLQVSLTLSFAALMALLASLRVEVDESHVAAGFTGGLLARRIPLERIESARVRRLPWYAGWGIRRVGDGWAYTVWGRDAVELGLVGGGVFVIGTDQPEALLAAVEEARGLAELARRVA